MLKDEQRSLSQPKATRRDFLGGLSAGAATLLLPRLASGEAQSAYTTEQALHIGGVPVKLSLAAISQKTVRISWLDARSHLTPNDAFRHKGLLDKPWPTAQHVLTESIKKEEFQLGGLTASIQANPLRIRLENSTHQVSQEITINEASGEISFPLGGPVFGLGEGGHQYDRRGVSDSLVNGQVKPALFVTGGRNPMPWLVSPAGWAIYVHQPLGTMDLRGENGIFKPTEPPQAQDIFVILASEPAELLQEFAILTGMPHLPPLWAFGYHQSHRTLTSREEVLQEARTFREKKLPCDSMIYLGTGFAPSGWNQGHGSFAFNENIFPDPQKMFRELHDEHFRVVLHVLDVPQDLHGTIADPPSNDPDAAVNYWPQHIPIMQTGMDGWWADDGDELPAELRLTRNRLYWDGPKALRPNVRPFALHRNSYAGSAMYGWLWSGDVQCKWETLRTHVAISINTSLSGLPWWGSDTGGFFSTPELTAELYVRWFQFSAFCTLFRSHGRTWKLRLPWGWDTGDYGPVEDDLNMLPPKTDLHNPEVEEICRKFLNLRYQLLPYTYSCAYECHSTGVPVVRPLWLHAPKDSRACTVPDQFFWGRDLIVAPVVDKGATTRTVYLPAGTWYDFWTHEKFEGGREYTRGVELATLPLFARAGAILPIGAVRQSTADAVDPTIDITVFPGTDGAFTLYEDDGVSFDYERGARSRIHFIWSDKDRTLQARLADGDLMGSFTTRKLTVAIAATKQTHPAQFDGQPLSVRL